MTIAEALEKRGGDRRELECKINIAQAMLEEGFNKPVVVKVTGLEMEKIEALIQELDKRH